MPTGIYERTLEQRAKTSASLKGRTRSASHCANISAGKKGRKFTPEHCAAMGAARMGRKLSPIHRMNISVAGRGRVYESRRAPVGAKQQKGSYMWVKTVDGWRREGRVVAGLEPGDGRIAHHIDEDKLNNDPTNIRVFESSGAHTRHHNEERRALGG